MEKQGTCTTNSCTQRGRRISCWSYELRLLPTIDFVSSSELVIHVPVFPIMITTTPSYIAPSRALQVGESPVQVLNPCMQHLESQKKKDRETERQRHFRSKRVFTLTGHANHYYILLISVL